MERLFFWRRRLEESEIAALEGYLSGVLLPVTPRPNYVRDLGRRLANYPAPMDLQEHTPNWVQYTLVIAAALASGTVLVVLGVKAVLALGGLGALTQVKRQADEKRSAAPRLVSG
jgi:hypothetical protein